MKTLLLFLLSASVALAQFGPRPGGGGGVTLAQVTNVVNALTGGGIPTLNGTGTNLSAQYLTSSTNWPFVVLGTNGAMIGGVDTNANLWIGAGTISNNTSVGSLDIIPTNGGAFTSFKLHLSGVGNKIGSGNPVNGAALDVPGAVYVGTLNGTNADILGPIGSTLSPIFHAGTNSANGLTVTTNGNVGIWTATPQSPLVVAGEAVVTNLVNRGKGSWWGAGGSNVQWRMVKNITLTNVVDVSACAYNPLTHTFWTIHNNSNGRITEWNLQGEFQRKLDWGASTVADGEAITWMGGNTFSVVDEDSNRIFIFDITNNASGTTLSTNNTRIVQLAASIGVDAPSGVEGLAWDADRNGWWVAREKTPAQLMFVSADGATTNNWFTTAQMQTFTNSTHTDFSDLYLDRENQLLWVTQDEGGTQTDRVLAISLITSNLVYSIDTTNFGQLEGVSVTPDGQLLLAGEANQFAVYAPFEGGLNSGINWTVNQQTNLPAVPKFPYGSSIGFNQVLSTNVAYTNISITFPTCSAQMSTNAVVAMVGARYGQGVASVTSTNHGLGCSFSGFPSNDTFHVIMHNYSADPISLPASMFWLKAELIR